ncbi:hypothetical protein [Turicibacter sanguinis]|uniref:hypothetical protein n=1 Tax=Turicibacter sanguinis TaxID=154288 RepID=UPI0006BF6FD9|nr:hypothetical protein [Turicibacter sanguinis]MCU7196511.1 hypothetical protein [Turicibacter sanguinis]MTP71640.1 hypothetical protein [Turicibacter sanguinis]CUM79974.1 Uncharacterised protein [Turicibacter sanguinis]
MKKSKNINHYRYIRRQNATSTHSSRLNLFTKIISILPLITLLFSMLETSFIKGYLKYFNLDPNLTAIITKPSSIVSYFLITLAISLILIIYFYWVNQLNNIRKILFFILPTIILPLLSIFYITYLKLNELISTTESFVIFAYVLTISLQIFVFTLMFNSIAKDIKEILEPNKVITKSYKHLNSLNLLIGIFFIVIGILFIPVSVQPLGELAAKYKKDFTILNDNQVIISYVQQNAITFQAEINDNNLMIYIDRGYTLLDLTNTKQMYKKFDNVILYTQSPIVGYCKSE